MNTFSDQKPIDRLRSIMRTLRSDEGCPWDREQSLDTLKKYLIEECFEVVDAIEKGDREELKDELGDLLLQVVFQAQICQDEGGFDFDDVATQISDKLVRRHPHVFGDISVADSDEVVRNWDAIKQEEKADEKPDLMDGLPRAMPALLRAQALQKKVAKVGFDWPNAGEVLDKIDEELAEVKTALAHESEERVQEELGDLLFSVVNLCRYTGGSAEGALQATITRFASRFEALEARVESSGRRVVDCDLEELESHWQAVKEKRATG